jgi:hypothetical protein
MIALVTEIITAVVFTSVQTCARASGTECFFAVNTAVFFDTAALTTKVFFAFEAMSRT